MKLCPVCSIEYPDDVKFCPNDGQTLRSLAPANDLVGQVVADRYHVLKKLGQGGMGQVYLAEHVKMGRRSAIKVMNPSMVHDTDAVSRFNREAANASRITHPNVCAIYDFGETPDGLIYLAMEFIEGEPLTALLEQSPGGMLEPRRAGHIFLQVAEALQAAHDLGIVHRDLKPDNIMVTKSRGGSDVVKVVDFGIAKAVEGSGDNQKVTKTGLVVGTPEFMSPEQLAGDKVDGRSDLYSLALVLYRMLTGRLPFDGSTVQETMVKRLTDEPLPLERAAPGRSFPAGLQQTLDTALTRTPADRYQSVAKFAGDVAGILGLTGATPTDALVPATRASDARTQLLNAEKTAVTVAPPRAQPAARSRRTAVIGAVVVLVAAGGGYTLYAHHQPPPQVTAAAHDSAPATAPRVDTSRVVSQPAAHVPGETRPSSAPAIDAALATKLLNDWVDRIDAIDGAVLRDSARAVYETHGLASKDRALAAYLVANAYAKLEDRAQGCDWARRALTLDSRSRSYAALSQSLCGSQAAP